MSLDMLIPPKTTPGATCRWATVTQASPLRVKLDGEDDALNITPDTLVAGLAVDDRVWVQIVARRLVVVGKAGGVAAVTPGAWSTYTPSTSGITVGSGTLTGRYRQNGKDVDFLASFALGSGSAITGSVAIGLPVTPHASVGGSPFNVGFFRSGTGSRPGYGRENGSGAVQCYAILANGTYGDQGTLSSTVPFTWASGDTIRILGRYEAA